MEYRSSDPDIDVPQGRLDEFVLGAVAVVDPARVAIHDGDTGHEICYGEITGQVGALASALAERGIGPGDVVAVHMPNGVEFAVALLGVSACGATVMPVAAGETLNELRTDMLIAGAGTLLTHADLLAVSGPVAASLLLDRDRFVVVGSADLGVAAGAGGIPGGPGCPPFTAYEQLLAGPALRLDAEDAIDPATHPVCLPFSSGTTGAPKPVLLSHRALVANALQFTAALGLPEPQRTLAFLPFSHIYALTTGLIAGLIRGDTIVTMRRFSVQRAQDLFRDQRITLAFIVPPVATTLVSHPEFDLAALATLRVVVSGAAALDPTVARSIGHRLDVEILQGYGLAEMGPVTHVMRLGAGMPVESVGTAVPGVRFRVVDPESGSDVDPPPSGGLSARGELLVRGPNAMLGYLGRPEATAEILDADGWIHTGDLVTVDDRGCIRVVDRLKEVLKNRGFQVSPAELESLLREYPGVADAAVTGVRGDDASDERPFALVVRNVGAGSGPSEEGLLRYVADRTAEYKHLVGVAFVDRVPRSDAGKILRRELAGLLPADRMASRG